MQQPFTGEKPVLTAEDGRFLPPCKTEISQEKRAGKAEIIPAVFFLLSVMFPVRTLRCCQDFPPHPLRLLETSHPLRPLGMPDPLRLPGMPDPQALPETFPPGRQPSGR